ncbi:MULTISPECIES: hypothetical protein [Aliivibrio]|uniref:hypothetical protein n=1 Tax=Aliivibrio TaxID=511678 RepID=UPI001669BBEE|nr:MULTISPECIES: hypothetical protein [Aliivibrio]MBD1569758.1 hypothetical protein [Aliivibrio sp. S10_S31]USR97995.1 hypothetical protein AVFI_16150 [Aliivibrio fischeri ATCC 7744 = JCM 18803 = DSM 507]GGK43657.1 hypothetical protein GCM10007987_28700 [Aliivibrio fischeri]
MFDDLTELDMEILKCLQKEGLTVNNGIKVIMNKIYYLNYIDRILMRKAIDFLGEGRKDYIISNIYNNKRLKYYHQVKKK